MLCAAICRAALGTTRSSGPKISLTLSQCVSQYGARTETATPALSPHAPAALLERLLCPQPYDVEQAMMVLTPQAVTWRKTSQGLARAEREVRLIDLLGLLAFHRGQGYSGVPRQ